MLYARTLSSRKYFKQPIEIYQQCIPLHTYIMFGLLGTTTMMILSNFKHVTFRHIFLRKSFNQNTSNAIDVFTKTFVLVPHHPSSTCSEPFGNPIEYRVFRHSFWQLHNKTEAYFVYRRSRFIDKTRSKHFDKPARISLLHLWMTLMVIYYLSTFFFGWTISAHKNCA